MFGWLDRLRPLATLIMRLALGLIMLAEGYSKVVPPGHLHGFIHEVLHLGFPAWLGYVAAFTEFIGGMLLILGIITRLVALFVLIDMCFAMSTKSFSFRGIIAPMGSALPLACGALALMVISTGAGWLALDYWTGRGGHSSRGKSK